MVEVIDKINPPAEYRLNPYYSRWHALVTRYLHPVVSQRTKNTLEGQAVCDEWLPPTSEGFPRFLEWITEAITNNPTVNRAHFRIKRLDDSLPFCPENCTVVSHLGWEAGASDRRKYDRRIIKRERATTRRK